MRFANRLRVGASPSVAYALNRAFYEIDLREVLPAVRVPTLVLYRRELVRAVRARRRRTDPGGTRRCSSRGRTSSTSYLSPEVPDEIERFVAGEQLPVVPDTVLATILFTDIVGSSARAAELGDRAWRELLGAPPRARAARADALPRRGEGHGGGRLLRDLRRSGAGDPLRPRDRRGRARARAGGAGGPAHGRVRAARGQGRGPRGRDRRPRLRRGGRRARCSSRRRSRTWSRARASSSRTAASTS